MKRLFAFLMAIALAILMPVHAFAAGGNGSGGGKGNGSGGGSAEALTVESASIEDGAQIGSKDTITLVFSKNVCNQSVRENNAQLVTLTDSTGSPVAVDVVLCDDQIEPEKKNNIEITFTEPLTAGSYTLTAQAGITSKSGAVMAKDYVLTFTVSGDAVETTEAPAATPTETPKAANKDGNSSAIVIGVIVLAVVAGGAVVLLKKKHE